MSAQKRSTEKTSQREERVTRVTRREGARARYALERGMRNSFSPSTHMFDVVIE